MKKIYTAPQIVFEDFSLSTTIATTCDFIANFAEGSCGYEVKVGLSSWTIFVSGVCETSEGVITENGEAVYNKICYHIPTDDKNLFNS